MTACRKICMCMWNCENSKLQILLFSEHQNLLESDNYSWNGIGMKLMDLFMNFHDFNEKQRWVSNVVLSWEVQWKKSFSMRKPSTSFGCHFTTTGSILKSFGVLKRGGSEVLIFEIFICICKNFDMPSCNSSMKQNKQHFSTIPHQFVARNVRKNQNEHAQPRQIKLYPTTLLLSKFGENPFIRKKCPFMHIWST